PGPNPHLKACRRSLLLKPKSVSALSRKFPAPPARSSAFVGPRLLSSQLQLAKPRLLKLCRLPSPRCLDLSESPLKRDRLVVLSS
ncbi:hypothetical protein, partial [Synechococcus sp. R6-10]|uniref:hypothetical protein n=1 Tax=Synechococcus sp. R6-10 TaxID=2291956 RepID=UPI0039C42C77